MNQARTTLVVLSLCGLSARSAWADPLESLERKLSDAASKLRSMSAKQTMDVQTDSPEMKMFSRSVGTFEYMLKGDKTLWRAEMKTSSVTTVAGQETKMDQSSLTISDGKYAYSLSDVQGQRTAVKMDLPPRDSTLAGRGFISELRKHNDLKLMPDEKIEGQTAYVIEARSRKTAENPNPTGATTYYVLKDSGIVAKTVSMDANGKPTSTMTLSDIRINSSIDPSRFEFKAPEGVQLVDISKKK
jgi:outer membrane lipoprotein-sorting protein